MGFCFFRQFDSLQWLHIMLLLLQIGNKSFLDLYRWGGFIMAAAKKNENNCLVYRGKPLVRSGNTLYYGDMKDEYIIMLQIQNTKKDHDIEVAENVMISLMRTDESLNPLERIVKTGEKTGLYTALDIATVWLDRALTTK